MNKDEKSLWSKPLVVLNALTDTTAYFLHCMSSMRCDSALKNLKEETNIVEVATAHLKKKWLLSTLYRI